MKAYTPERRKTVRDDIERSKKSVSDAQGKQVQAEVAQQIAEDAALLSPLQLIKDFGNLFGTRKAITLDFHSLAQCRTN